MSAPGCRWGNSIQREDIDLFASCHHPTATVGVDEPIPALGDLRRSADRHRPAHTSPVAQLQLDPDGFDGAAEMLADAIRGALGATFKSVEELLHFVGDHLGLAPPLDDKRLVTLMPIMDQHALK